VVADPTGETAKAFMELGAAVVREVAKMSSSNAQGGAASKAPKVVYDQGQHAILVRSERRHLQCLGECSQGQHAILIRTERRHLQCLGECTQGQHAILVRTERGRLQCLGECSQGQYSILVKSERGGVLCLG